MLFLFFVSVYLFQVEVAEILPTIIRTTNSFQRKSGLVLVKHHLEKHVFVGSVLAIEHKLQVSCHREDFIVCPILGGQFLQVGYLSAVLVQV